MNVRIKLQSITLILYFSQDPCDFQAAFDELVEYSSSTDNWKQIKEELTGRGVGLS